MRYLRPGMLTVVSASAVTWIAVSGIARVYAEEAVTVDADVYLIPRGVSRGSERGGS